LHSAAQGRAAHPGSVAVQPLRGRGAGVGSSPGCAARPWAAECSAFGVKTASRLRNRPRPFRITPGPPREPGPAPPRSAITMKKRIGSALALALASYVLGALAGSPPPGAQRPHGIPWTTSRITGSPDPPPPYRIERAFPKLTFKNPLLLTRAPGT